MIMKTEGRNSKRKSVPLFDRRWKFQPFQMKVRMLSAGCEKGKYIFLGARVLAWGKLCDGKRHGIKERGTDVEKMTVQQTHTKKCQNVKADINVCNAPSFYKQTDGLSSVISIGKNARDSARIENLNDRVVQSRWEEAAEALHR